MTERMTVHQEGQAIYDIVMKNDFSALGEEAEKLGIRHRKLCIVTDSNVAPLYLEEVKTVLAPFAGRIDSFVFPAGEESKNLDTVRRLYEFLILKQYDRSDWLIALGGGVTGDLCGFAAATYLRGIPFIQIPTTLLSQVDSSIGGKTGVDFDSYKNMVGAFYMPGLVYINSATLLTLPEEQFVSGMGEVLKHGLIKDRSYYEWTWEHREAILSRDLDICREMVRVSDEIKRQVVEEDPMERGERALLNFGHTLGHAVEKLRNFELLHGQCVALGCIAAAELSARRGLLDRTAVEEIRTRFQVFGFPVTADRLAVSEVIEATRNDKKMEAGSIKFILLKAIGQAYVDKTVTDEEMKQALSAIMPG